MTLRSYLDAARGRRPAGGGDGHCRTRSNRPLTLELYTFDSCPYCQRVYRVVERLEVPLRYRNVLEDESAAAKLVAVGGLDQVPCLFIDGKPLYESADIIAFLEENFGESSSSCGPAPG